MRQLKSTIENQLSRFSRRRLSDEHRGEAAVLLSIIEEDSRPCFLLTKRSETVATHKGHVSFPGGMRDESDPDLFGTALREAEEELGIPQDQVDILGEFHEYMAATLQIVTPVIGIIRPGVDLVPSPDEVAYVLNVPFEFFQTATPRVQHYRWRGRNGKLYHYDYGGESVWGLTASIIRDFLRLIGRNVVEEPCS